MGELPDEVRRAYEAEIRRLQVRLETASEEDAPKIRDAISDLEEELLLEDWPMED